MILTIALRTMVPPSAAHRLVRCSLLLVAFSAAVLLGLIFSSPVAHAQDLPTDALPLNGAISVDSGYEFTCAALESGKVLCWGRSSLGQLGDGRGIDSPWAPVEVRGDRGRYRRRGGEFACLRPARRGERFVLGTGAASVPGRDHGHGQPLQDSLHCVGNEAGCQRRSNLRSARESQGYLLGLALWGGRGLAGGAGGNRRRYSV